ncbi:MAG: hypothetical protein GY774_13215 [Planctomycetes bacterium]|nr:hypothetical protein [Planctomycetota bacterium]
MNKELQDAIDNLRNHQKQLDMDGCMVGVSRQALDIILKALEQSAGRITPVEQWQPIETAPKDESLFVCRDKRKPHVTFEAAIFKDQESWEIPEEYDCLQNMTIDEPICDGWDLLEWRPIETPNAAMTGAKE